MDGVSDEMFNMGCEGNARRSIRFWVVKGFDAREKSSRHEKVRRVKMKAFSGFYAFGDLK